jgi:hypothetical protein
MLATFHKAVVLTATVAMVAVLGNAAVSYAQRDAGAKARGDVGTGFWNSQSTQPAMGRSMPTEARRSYSYSPSDKGEKTAPAAKDAGRCGSQPSVKSKAGDDGTAQAPKATRRAFSYEPAMKAQSGSRNSGTSQKAPWSYQKTDPRRYQN